MSEVQTRAQRDGAVQRSTASMPVAGSERRVQLKRSVRATEGYDAQSALLEPVQMFGGGWGFFGFGDDKKAGGDDKKADAADKKADAADKKADAADKKADAADKKADAADKKGGEPAHQGAEAKGTIALPADLPKDFGSESVLRTWIGLFNTSLMKMKETKKAKWIEKLKKKEWGDEGGLNYDLLAAAAAKEPAPAAKKGAKGTPPPRQAQVAQPGPVSNARILAMLSKGNGSLFNGIEGYSALCLQFSVKMMEEMGAKRADGSRSMGEQHGSAKGTLTPLYRGLRLKELPPGLPAGYQICLVSRPDWGFTEVGNHWFISAGDGYYLDNVMGVTNGQQMEDSLIGTTGDQWGRRVVDKGLSGTRKAMGQKFVAAHPQFKEHEASGRTKAEQQKKKGRADNPDYKDASASEVQALAQIKQFVKDNRRTYAPRVWVVEPTTKVSGGGQ